MELTKPAQASPVTDEPGQAALGQEPNLGWKPRRLRVINGTTISHAAALGGHLTYTGHDIGAVVTGTAWIFLRVINTAAAGNDHDKPTQMHY